jgi:hypothetical protein|tara:strand:- start:227 stop:481 length:255 start_codon:yes stop_codon:yes gene_type:complete
MAIVKEAPNHDLRDYRKRRVAPLFARYTIDELAIRLRYSEEYLVFIKKGYRRLSDRFITNACGILNLPEQELFGSPEISGEVEE